MSFFRKVSKAKRHNLSSLPPSDPQWARTPKGAFFRFADLDPEEQGLSEVGGIFVIWHGGVRPEWVYVGFTDNLASTFHQLGNNRDLMRYEVNGHLFVTWALVLPDYQEGAAVYLSRRLSPLIDNPELPDLPAEDEVPVLAPSR